MPRTGDRPRTALAQRPAVSGRTVDHLGHLPARHADDAAGRGGDGREAHFRPRGVTAAPVDPRVCDQLVTTGPVRAPHDGRCNALTSTFAPEASWARGDLNPHVLSDTGT